MTEQEAIERIRSGICNEIGTARYCHDNCMYGEDQCAYSMAIAALEEIQQYRAVGTPDEMKLKEYLAIGTPEECRAAVWQLKAAKEDIRKLLCHEYACLPCEFCRHDENEEAMCVRDDDSGSWCCENAAWKEHGLE